MQSEEETTFLSEINSHLPPNIDWKLGAITYLKNLIQSEGSHHELYHLIKPFMGGPDFTNFYSEMYGFLNILERLNPPIGANILDVACGPGWTSHFLAKLGFNVSGIDISEDLISIAKKRVQSEPFQVYEGVPLSAKFIVHDIEQSVLNVDMLFDAAFFESALHHFYNPVEVLKNVAQTLKDDGVICVWEGAAPPIESMEAQRGLELMKKYHTLERPYSREQITELLRLTGFKHYEFYAQINGLFNISNFDDMQKLKGQIESKKYWNVFIASRTGSFFTNRGHSLCTSETDHFLSDISREISHPKRIQEAVRRESQQNASGPHTLPEEHGKTQGDSPYVILPRYDLSFDGRMISHLDHACQNQYPGRLPPRTRLRFMKQFLLRAMRVYTREQVDFNGEIVAVLDGIARRLGGVGTFLNRLAAELERHIGKAIAPVTEQAAWQARVEEQLRDIQTRCSVVEEQTQQMRYLKEQLGELQAKYEGNSVAKRSLRVDNP